MTSKTRNKYVETREIETKKVFIHKVNSVLLHVNLCLIVDKHGECKLRLTTIVSKEVALRLRMLKAIGK